MELKDPSIDPFLWKYCADVIEKCNAAKTGKEDAEGYKSHEVKSSKKDEADDEEEEEEPDDMMQCLIKSKHDMKNKKCKGRVEYIQLLELSRIEFTPKFKALCQADVIRRCAGVPHNTALKVSISTSN